MRAILYLSCMVICSCVGDSCMIKIMRNTVVVTNNSVIFEGHLSKCWN